MRESRASLECEKPVAKPKPHADNCPLFPGVRLNQKQTLTESQDRHDCNRQQEWSDFPHGIDLLVTVIMLERWAGIVGLAEDDQRQARESPPRMKREGDSPTTRSIMA